MHGLRLWHGEGPHAVITTRMMAMMVATHVCRWRAGGDDDYSDDYLFAESVVISREPGSRVECRCCLRTLRVRGCHSAHSKSFRGPAALPKLL